MHSLVKLAGGISHFFKSRESAKYFPTVFAAGGILGLFAQMVLAHRGYGHFWGWRLLVLEIVSIFFLLLAWIMWSVLFSRMAGLDVSESLRLDAPTYFPIFILLGSCISFLIPFINLDKTLLLLAGVGVCALKVRLMRKYSVFSHISERKFLVDAAVASLLAFLTLLFFWRIVSNSPLHEGSIADDILVFFPFRFFAATILRAGIIPLWNPFVFSGMPFLADSQAAVFHPVNMLLTLFVSAGSLSYKAGQYAVVVNLFIAGLVMYFYARTIKLTPFGSLISALVFMFGGFLVAHIRHLPVLNVVVWLPLIFLFAEKVLNEKRLVYSVLGVWPLPPRLWVDIFR